MSTINLNSIEKILDYVTSPAKLDYDEEKKYRQLQNKFKNIFYNELVKYYSENNIYNTSRIKHNLEN